MAIDRTGIDSLEEGTSFKTGAPDLRLTGDVASIKALPINIQTLILQYWVTHGNGSSADRIEDVPESFIKEILPLLSPQSSAQGGMEPMSAAQGGIAGYRGGQLVKPGPGRPGYQGDRPPSVRGREASEGARESNEDRYRYSVGPVPPAPTVLTPDVKTPLEEIAADYARDYLTRATSADLSTAIRSGQGIGDYPTGMPQGSPGQLNPYVAPVTGVEGPPSILNPYVAPVTGVEGPPSILNPYVAPVTGVEGPPSILNPYVAPVPTGDGDGDGEGDEDTGTNAPVVTGGVAGTGTTGTTADPAIQAAYAAQGLQFPDYYVGADPTTEQDLAMRALGAVPEAVGRETWPAMHGGRAGYAGGGISDLRQGFLLGGIGRKIKKILKSPAGKIAAAVGLAYLTKGMGPKAGWKKFLMGTPAKAGAWIGAGSASGPGLGATYTGSPATQGIFGKVLSSMKYNPVPWIVGASALGGATAEEDKDTDDFEKQRLADLAKWRSKFAGLGESFTPYYANQAQGGRIGYDEGGLSMESIALEFKQEFGYDMSLAEPAIIKKFIDDYKKKEGWYKDVPVAQGGRIGAQEGGLMDLGGMEKDYRQEGGFVPLGGQERADDVPARLSKNEFVFTADAVRAAGGGDIDAGAEVMENVMENLEQGGKVSEESQGLEGARDMFATSQRLEGVM